MPEVAKNTEAGSAEKVSLLYIFWVFLKLGATAFGGYMSLVAIVQKQLVDIDKKLKEEDLLDGISMTSVLPGRWQSMSLLMSDINCGVIAGLLWLSWESSFLPLYWLSFFRGFM